MCSICIVIMEVLYIIILCIHVDHHTLPPVGQGESADMLRGDQYTVQYIGMESTKNE